MYENYFRVFGNENMLLIGDYEEIIRQWRIEGEFNFSLSEGKNT